MGTGCPGLNLHPENSYAAGQGTELAEEGGPGWERKGGDQGGWQKSRPRAGESRLLGIPKVGFAGSMRHAGGAQPGVFPP